MPSCGKAAASTALPQPPNTSQKVPKNSAASFRDINPSIRRVTDCLLNETRDWVIVQALQTRSHRWTPQWGVHFCCSSPASVAGRQRDGDALFGELIPDELEVLILRDRNWAGVGFALDLARWVLHVGF